MAEFIGRPQLPTGMAEMAVRLRSLLGGHIATGLEDLGAGIGDHVGGDQKAEQSQNLKREEEYLRSIRELTLEGRLERPRNQVDMQSVLPRLNATIGLGDGIGRQAPGPIHGMNAPAAGDLTTDDLWAAMGGRGPAPGGSARIKPKGSSDGSKSRVLVDDALVAEYKAQGVNLAPFKGKELNISTLMAAGRSHAALEERRKGSKDKDALRIFKLAIPQAAIDPRYAEAAIGQDTDKMEEVLKEYEEMVRRAEARGKGKGDKADPGKGGDGERVKVMGKDGKKFTVPQAQLQQALDEGYTKI